MEGRKKKNQQYIQSAASAVKVQIINEAKFYFPHYKLIRRVKNGLQDNLGLVMVLKFNQCDATV